MAIQPSKPPQEILAALESGLKDYLGSSDPRAERVRTNNLAIHVFTLGAAKVPSGLAAAKSAGWRFIAMNSKREPIAGDVVQPKGGPAWISGVSIDPLIERAIAAYQELSRWPLVKKKDYELRILRIPSVLTEAFWLKASADQDDRLIPLLTASMRLDKTRAYTVPEFLKIVSELIQASAGDSNKPVEISP